VNKFFSRSVLPLAVAGALALAGCAARSAISAEDFQKQAKSAGYTVSSQAAGSTGATKCLSATKGGSDLQITFYAFGTAADAQSWYSSQKSGISGSGKTVVDTDTYNKYTVTVGDISFLLVRMDNTAVLCKTSTAKSGEAERFVSSIKY
jgi:hypothetical protein